MFLSKIVVLTICVLARMIILHLFTLNVIYDVALLLNLFFSSKGITAKCIFAWLFDIMGRKQSTYSSVLCTQHFVYMH